MHFNVACRWLCLVAQRSGGRCAPTGSAQAAWSTLLAAEVCCIKCQAVRFAMATGFGDCGMCHTHTHNLHAAQWRGGAPWRCTAASLTQQVAWSACMLSLLWLVLLPATGAHFPAGQGWQHSNTCNLARGRLLARWLFTCLGVGGCLAGRFVATTEAAGILPCSCRSVVVTPNIAVGFGVGCAVSKSH